MQDSTLQELLAAVDDHPRDMDRALEDAYRLTEDSRRLVKAEILGPAGSRAGSAAAASRALDTARDCENDAYKL